MSIAFVAGKLLRTIGTILLATIFVFVLLRISSNPARELLGEEATIEAIAYFNQRYGLDQPVLIQFFNYISSILQGDFGTSFRDDRPALDVVLEAAPNSLRLGLSSLAFALLLGLPAGILAALKPGGMWDRLVMSFAVLGFSLPNFFFGILLILVFTLYFQLLPSAGGNTWTHMIMPVLTMGTGWAGQFARFARTSMIETLNSPFVSAALVRGQSTSEMLVRHAVPNASVPTITIIGLVLGGVIGGATVTEIVFSWPGMGRLLVNAVQIRDLPVVQLIVLLITLIMSLTNLAVDLIYGLVDPRIRIAGHEKHG